jgi:HEAT repeat protein
MRSWIIGTLGVLVLASTASAQPEPEKDPYREALELEKRGRDQDAFLKYLQSPGGEHAAIRLARPKAREYLELLRTKGRELPLPRFKVIEGDLLLALSERGEALACYRAAARKTGATSKETWKQGFLPWDQYFVEVPPMSPRDDPYGYGIFILRPQAPFTLGPGSHRDNWLLRRFLALEAWDEAEREFARLWDFHMRYSQAYITSRWEQDPANPKASGLRDYVIEESGFSSLGLLFALDYAFFWKQRKDNDKALDILREAVVRLHLDDDYQGAWEPTPLDPKDTRDYPRQIGYGIGFGYGGANPGGITAKEFLRLAYGEFKNAGQEAKLVEMLQREIKLGKNRLRRALARIRLHEGKPDEALALELAYLRIRPRLDDTTRTQRRGHLYEDFQKLPQAVAEYEKVLTALPKKLKKGEQHARDIARDEVLTRLLALYAALGQTQKVLDLSLRQFDLGRPITVSALEQAEQVFRRAAQADRFTAWLKKRRDQTSDPLALAGLCWLLRDYPATITAVAKAARREQSWSWQEQDAWEKRFVELKMQRELVKALAGARPHDLKLRWRLLVLEERTKGAEAIEVMEKMLEAASRDDSHYVPTPAYVYPLLRLYEQNGQLDKLVRQGRHILGGQKPFQDIDHDAYEPRHHGVVGYKEQQILVDCLLLILPHLKNEKDLQAFDKIARRWTRWAELRNQLARRRQGDKAQRLDPFADHVRDYAKVSVHTVGLPKGVRLLTTRDDVHTISADGQWVGTSWGLVRYREPARDTLDILQVPLGASVTDILNTPAGFFVGTEGALFRLDDPNSDNPRPVAVMTLEGEPFLTWWRDQLWVEIPHHVLQYDPKRQEVRDHHDVDEWRGGAWRRALVVAADRLWSRTAVFDEKTGEFQRLPHEKAIHVLGDVAEFVKGQPSEVWASMALSKFGSRPALIDPKTLAVTALPVANIKPGEACSGDVILGADQDHVWFGPDPVLAYHRETGQVELVRPPADDEKRPHQGPAFWHRAYRGLQRTYVQSATFEGVPGLNPYSPTGWRHAAGRILLGAAKPSFSIDDGGLFAVNPKTLQWTKVGHAGSDLGHLSVNNIVFDDDARRAYVSTDGGVTILSLPEDNIIDRITVADGLPSNRVTDAVRLGQKLYVACRPFYDEGGLAVFDTKTKRVQRFSRADGLPSYHIKQLRVRDGQVHILYDTFLPERTWDHHHESQREGAIAVGRHITFKSSIFDPRTGKISAGTEILEPLPGQEKAGQLPLLGGSMVIDVTHQGKRYLGGSHGLVIFNDPQLTLGAARPMAAVKKVPTRSQRWRAEAGALSPTISAPEDLAKFLRRDNPLLREKALDAVPEEGRGKYLPVLQDAVRDQHVPVRRKAARLLKTLATPEAAAVAKPLLDDPDPIVRAHAALTLARGGDMPALKHFREILHAEPAPLDDLHEVYDVLARQGSAKAFALLLEHGWLHDPADASPGYLKVLGEQVRKNPELADLLLKAYDPEPPDESGEARHKPRRRAEFAAQVFRAAGKPMLPVLYKALRSPDRVVRSNAARGCGAIGDLAAAPHLVQALDLESGLARASIVEALARLKAKDALPALIKLYLDAVNDDWAWGSPAVFRSGAGFRSSQLGAAQAAMYEYLSDLDALKGAWQDLKSTARRPPPDPRRHENLLTAEHLLKAIRGIGPENAPLFYRTLAGARNSRLRLEAGIHLAAAAPRDLEKNLPILRNLTADPDPEVQIAATVSLHILSQPGTDKALNDWLSSPEYELKRLTLVALNRVQDGRRLAFARPRLQAIAGDLGSHSWFREQAGRLLRRSEPESK